MKNSIKHSSTAAFLILFASCGPSEYTLKSGGDTAKLKTKSGTELTGELICIQDNSVYLSAGEQKPKIFRVDFEHIEVIEVEGYTNRTWVLPWMLFQVVPTVMQTIIAASVDFQNPEVFLVFALPTALTYVLFETTTPAPPTSNRPRTMEHVEHLKVHARFPQGLAGFQLQQLLELNRQNEPQDLR